MKKINKICLTNASITKKQRTNDEDYTILIYFYDFVNCLKNRQQKSVFATAWSVVNSFIAPELINNETKGPDSPEALT